MTSPSVPGSVSILGQEEGLDEQSAGEHHHGGYRDHAGHYRGEEPRWKERPNTVNKFNITGLAFRDVLYLYLSLIFLMYNQKHLLVMCAMIQTNMVEIS